MDGVSDTERAAPVPEDGPPVPEDPTHPANHAEAADQVDTVDQADTVTQPDATSQADATDQADAVDRADAAGQADAAEQADAAASADHAHHTHPISAADPTGAPDAQRQGQPGGAPPLLDDAAAVARRSAAVQRHAGASTGPVNVTATRTGQPASSLTASSTTAPGTTAPGTTAPGTTAPGTGAPGTGAPGTGDTIADPAPRRARGADSFSLWPVPQMRLGRDRRSGGPIPRQAPAGPHLPTRPVRQPIPGLVSILLLALVSGFFAWVSAEPLLLAAGHAEQGTATVTECTGGGIGRRCIASFQGTDASFTSARATLVGADRGNERPETTLPAQMVDPDARIAYAGGSGGLHARWAIGLAFLLLSGFAIAWASGAARLPTPRQRRRATAACALAPFVLLLGMVIAAW